MSLPAGSSMDGKVPQRNACVACRKAKIRCQEIPGSSANDTCVRCSRMGLACDYSAKRRGRKGKETSSIPDASMDDTQHSFAIPNFPEQTTPTGQYGLPTASVPSTTTGVLDPSSVEVPTNAASTSQSIELPNKFHCPSLGSWNAHDDPVSLGHLNQLEAEHLVTEFLQHLNPVISLFDPKLYTFHFIRSTSSLLFSSILSVTSNFFLKHLNPYLHIHAQSLLNRAIIEGTCDVGVMQSIMLLIHWKRSSDKTGWLKIGTAIRIGYSLRLHCPRVGGVPEVERQARMLFSAERAWYCLSCMDRAYSWMFNLPPTILNSHLGNGETWAREHHWHEPGDLHLACASSLRDFEKLDDSLSTLTLDMLTDVGQCHLQKWFGLGIVSGLSTTSHKILKTFALWFILIIEMEKQSRDTSKTKVTSHMPCFVAAEKLIDQMQILAEDGLLRYLPDSFASILSKVGLYFNQSFFEVSVHMRENIIHLMTRVHRFCDQSAGGELDCPPAFIARYYSRLLRRLTIEVIQQSRAASPVNMNDGVVLDVQAVPSQVEVPNYLQTLEQFFQNSAPAQDEQWALDGAFWSSILVDYDQSDFAR